MMGTCELSLDCHSEWPWRVLEARRSTSKVEHFWDARQTHSWMYIWAREAGFLESQKCSTLLVERLGRRCLSKAEQKLGKAVTVLIEN